MRLQACSRGLSWGFGADSARKDKTRRDEMICYTAVAWDDDTVTVMADGALSRAAELDWNEEAEGPEA